jgi:hypothetical protein
MLLTKQSKLFFEKISFQKSNYIADIMYGMRNFKNLLGEKLLINGCDCYVNGNNDF